MSARLNRWPGLLALLVVVCLGCGDDSDDPPELVGELLPLSVGNYWNYHHLKYDFDLRTCVDAELADTVLSQVVVNGINWYSTSQSGFIFPVSVSGNMLRWDEQGRLHTLTNDVDGIALDPTWPVQEGHFVPVGTSAADSQRIVVVIHSKQFTEVVQGQLRSDCYAVIIRDHEAFSGLVWLVLCPGIGMVRRVENAEFGCGIDFTLTSYHLESAANAGPHGPLQP